MHEALAGGWTRQPHFSLETLSPLHDLNHRFLDLLAAQSGVSRPTALAPEDLRRSLATLSAAQRAAASRCPYALFDLRLQDEEHWRLRLERAHAARVADEMPVDEDIGEFVRLALFYAWHVACTAQLAASVLLGMSEATAQAFRAARFNGLSSLAGSEAVQLRPRWGASGPFWSALMRAAARADAVRLRRVQLFGLQLSAAARLP